MKYNNLKDTLIAIFIFVDDFIHLIQKSIKHAIERPNQSNPPTKKKNLSVSEIVTLGLFRFFTGYRNWKDFYKHIKTYHQKDFPNLPTYKSFLHGINDLVWLATLLLENFMQFFRKISCKNNLKFVDSSRLEVCRIKREFSHKVCKRIANKSKSSMGWFYGFKLHIICNELMQILDFRITSGNIDDRKGLEMIWNHIFGIIIADGGYVGMDLKKKAQCLSKTLITAVRVNMKNLMTSIQHQLLRMRQTVEIVFSVLKYRMGMETSLPRSELGHFAHYIWCLTAYQLKKFFEFLSNKRIFA